MTALLAVLSTLTVAQAPPGVTPPQLLGQAPRLDGVLMRRDTVPSVRVALTIGIDGAVTDVQLLSTVPPALGAAVIREVGALRFRPATRDGQPMATRIRWTIVMSRSPLGRGRARRGLATLPRSGDAALSGRLVERGTRRPLAGVPVLLPELDRTEITDGAGRFAFDTLPRRPLRLEVPALDHEPAVRTVRAGQASLLLRLEPRPTARYRTVVEAPTSDASRVVVSMQRAREIPGSAGDPLQVVQVLPGVARPASAGPGAGQLSIRGSAPEDTRFYLDGLPVSQLFHFGNVYSVVQDEWIGDIELRAGGFSAEYGEATGGLLGVSLAPIDPDGVHGHVDVNVYHAAALLTGAVGGGWTIGAAFRRSYVDAFLGAVIPSDSGLGFTAAPRYYDYQARADWRPNPDVWLRLLVFGSDDAFAVALDDPSLDDPSQQGFSIARSFHQIQGALDWRLTPELSLYLGLATSYQKLSLDPSRDTTFRLTFDPITVRGVVTWSPSESLQLRGGVSATATRFNVEADLPAPTKEGQTAAPLSSKERIATDEDGLSFEGAAFVEATWRPLDALAVIAGFRLSGWAGSFAAVAPDPRLALRWEATETTTATASVGLYHQAPSADESSQSFGNPDLSPERAVQTSLGVKQRIGDYLTLELTGFYKHLDQLVAPGEPGLGGPRYTSDGTGWVAGGELLLRLQTRWVDGWISYTLSRSRRTDGPGQEERSFSFDQTHVLSVVSSVDLTAGWRFGLRLRYATGNPFTPLVAGYYDAGADVYVPRDDGARLGGRVEDFFALDVRIDKEWRFDTWRLIAYLELNNVTNRANVEQVGYNYDYSERQDVESLPIIPSLGLRVAF